MDIKSVITVIISLFLMACGQQNMMTQQCDIVDIKPCTGNPPAINLNVNGQTVAPPHFCVGPGDTVTFKVTPQNGGTKTVATIPKDPTQFWLIGTNSPDQNEFELTAPTTKGDYNYYVVFKDGHCIDPRISVE